MSPLIFTFQYFLISSTQTNVYNRVQFLLFFYVRLFTVKYAFHTVCWNLTILFKLSGSHKFMVICTIFLHQIQLKQSRLYSKSENSGTYFHNNQCHFAHGGSHHITATLFSFKWRDVSVPHWAKWQWENKWKKKGNIFTKIWKIFTYLNNTGAKIKVHYKKKKELNFRIRTFDQTWLF